MTQLPRAHAPSEGETYQTRRAGFTLVELLVVMALITLIMSILSQAFVEGLDTVRNLKAIGDLQEQLRGVVVPLRDDLLRRHFLSTEKLSVNYDSSGLRPTTGFFRVQQGAAHNTLLEGSDSDGLPSYRVSTDVLHLTTAVVGTRRADYMTAEAPSVPNAEQLWAIPPAAAEPFDYRQSKAFLSQWAEVMWFTTPMIDADSGLQMTAGNSDTLLFNLHRRQKLLLTANAGALNGLASPNRIASTNLGLFPEIACLPDSLNKQPGALYFTTPSDSIVGQNRSMMDATGNFSLPQAMGTPYPAGSFGATIPGVIQESSVRRGDDRVITDVVSFEVKVLMPGMFEFQDIRTIQAGLGIAQDGAYDTATWKGPKLTIKAIQVVLRVWDSRTELTRQITMIQDM